MSIEDKVKREKEEYEVQVQKNLVETEKQLVAKDKMIPVKEIKNETISKMMEDYYPLEVLDHLEISEYQLESLRKNLRTMTKNVIKMSAPMLCRGEKCPMQERCPLFRSRVAPMGHNCPIELMLMDQWEKDYMDDLQVDIQSKVELDLVRDMIEADIMDWRTSHEIATNGLFDWNTVGFNEKTGKPYYRKEEAIALGIKLKFKARKDRLREDLMATRKMKAKFGLSKQLDPSKFSSDLTARFNEIRMAKDAQIVEDGPAMPDISQEMNDGS